LKKRDMAKDSFCFAGIQQESCRNPAGILEESCRNPGGILQESWRNPRMGIQKKNENRNAQPRGGWVDACAV
jgi:hypothetical protein